jgi:anaerobic selenocysteine-containing dehydrogenase
VASCEQPVRKAIPFLIQPEEIIPGKAVYYASTYYEGGEYCPIVVKVRDGRPIKIEGNELSPVTRGGTTARVQASILSLYDPDRYKHPLIDGKEASWEEVISR